MSGFNGRLRRTGLLLGLMVCLAASLIPAASADPNDRLDEIHDRKEKLSARIGRLNAHSDVVLRDLQVLDAKRARVEAEVNHLDAQLDRLNARISEVKVDLTEAQQRLTFLSEELQGILRDLDGRLEIFTARAVEAYKAGPAAYIDGLLSSQDFNTLVDRYAYYESAVEADAEIINEIQVLRDETEIRRNLVEEKENEIARNKLRLETDKTRLGAARAEKADLLAVRQAAVDQKRSLLNQIESKKSHYESVLNQLDRESDQIQALLAARASGGPLPVGGGQLLWPAAGPVTSGFGPRTHPIFGDTRMHTGVDIGAPYGAPVIAADTGVVAYSGGMSGYGNVVVIDHGGGLATLYGHLSSFSVGSGQTVGRGTPIASVGCTGYCTGPHLHFEVRINGTPVDPMPYLQ